MQNGKLHEISNYKYIEYLDKIYIIRKNYKIYGKWMILWYEWMILLWNIGAHSVEFIITEILFMS